MPGRQPRRQAADAAGSTLVEFVGCHQQFFNHAGKRRREGGLGEPAIRIDASGLEPVGGQVDAPAARVLPDVARDVGQLHRHAEVAGARKHRSRAHAHQQRHQGADRAGHARRIAMEFAERAIAPRHRIPGEAIQQGIQQRSRDAVILHHFRE